MDLVIIGKGADGTVMAQELGDLDDMGEFARLETELAETLAEEDVEAFGNTMQPASAPSSSTRICGPRASRRRFAVPAVYSSPKAASRSKRSSRPSRRTRQPPWPEESDMPLRASRLGRAAVVGAAVSEAWTGTHRKGRRRRGRSFEAWTGADRQDSRRRRSGYTRAPPPLLAVVSSEPTAESWASRHRSRTCDRHPPLAARPGRSRQRLGPSRSSGSTPSPMCGQVREDPQAWIPA